MDTFKDKQQLESLWESGSAPWQVWKTNGNGSGGVKPAAPVPVAEIFDRRNSEANRFTGSSKPVRN